MNAAKISTLLTLVFLLGCGTSGTKPDRFSGQLAPKIPDGYKPAKAQVLELNGENCCAQPLPNGQQLIYLSRHRPRHEQYQIYIYDDQTKQERRLTFHDGDDQGPAWEARSSRIFYGSTTDYLKEKPRYLLEALGRASTTPPQLNPNPLWTLAPFDLYASGRDGTAITRLTRSDEFDGEITVSPTKSEMIFTTLESGRSVLKRATTDGSGVQAFQKSEGHDSEAQFSPDGKEVVWVRTSADGKFSQLWVAKADGRKPRAVTNLTGSQLNPSWTTDSQEILFASNAEDATNFELYVIRKDGTCPRRLTYELGFDGHPRLKASGKQIVFTSDRTGTFQLYEMDLAPPACPAVN